MIKIKRKLLSLVIAFALAATMVLGDAAVFSFAAESEADGGLLWYSKPADGTMRTGVTAPVTDGKYVYVAADKTLYKLDASTGAIVGKAALSGSVGFNKIAPTLGNGKILLPVGGAVLNVVDADSMTLEKEVTYAEDQKGHQSLTPAVYCETDNSVYLGSYRKGYGGTYAKVSLDDYKVTEMVKSDRGFYWSGACDDGKYVIFGSNSNGDDDPNTPAEGDAILYAFNKDDGTVLSKELKNSGSICSTVVSYDGKYYFTSKAGKLYEAWISDGNLQTVVKTTLAGKTTCTPVIQNGKAYVGSTSNVEVIDLMGGTVEEKYPAPGDVKFIALSGDDIYCTYNSPVGGIYDVKAGRNYFTPAKDMQNYCISGIAKGDDGTLYYTNDTNNLMAVKNAAELISVQLKSSSRPYTGSVQLPDVIVKYGDRELVAGTDFTITGSDKYPGAATAVVKSKGAYEGKGMAVLDFQINKPVVAAQKTVTVKLTPTIGYRDITVKWNTQRVTGATVKYKVEYKKYGGSWRTIYSGTTKSSLKKSKLTAGAKYYFRVTPYVVVNGKTYKGSLKTSSYIYTLKSPGRPAISKSSKTYVKVKWKGISGETGYQVYRAASKNGKYTKVKTVKLANYSYPYAKIKTSRNKTYYYKVRAYKLVDGKYVYGPYSSVSKAYKLR